MNPYRNAMLLCMRMILYTEYSIMDLCFTFLTLSTDFFKLLLLGKFI